MSNEAGIQYVGTAVDGVTLGNSSGPTVLTGSTVKLGEASGSVALYGETPVAQADAIIAVTGTVSLTTTINAILTAIRNIGIIA